MGRKPPLTVVSSPLTGPPPPATLGEAGQDLWRRVMFEYRIDDVGGRELLYQAAGACDRLSDLKRCIDEDGATIRGRGGVVRAHPALRDELATRAFICRTLARLGLDFETVKPVGRPGSAVGWVPPR
jgi:hypothetical protein